MQRMQVSLHVFFIFKSKNKNDDLYHLLDFIIMYFILFDSGCAIVCVCVCAGVCVYVCVRVFTGIWEGERKERYYTVAQGALADRNFNSSSF